MQNPSRLIGVITAKAFQSEQRQLLDGILEQAQKLRLSTAVFSNIYNFQKYYAGTEIENKIYDLIASERIDGLILTAESILNPELQQYIYQKMIQRKIPVIVTGAELPDMTCVDNNVMQDFEEIAKHLITTHYFTEFDILTGFKNIETSQQRVQGIRNVMESYGLVLDDSHIIYGDFWMPSGENLAMEYITKKRKLPQAIICANDYMAYGLCDKFLEYGIKVPEDVTVIGYEYVGERFYHAPVLTTYQRNRKAVGISAVNALYQMMTGEQTETISTKGYLVTGNTCTCGVNHQQLSQELQKIRREQYYVTLNFEGNFEQQLTVCRSISDYIHTLQEFVYLIRDVKGLYLCLYENWCSHDFQSTSDSDTNNEIMLCYPVMKTGTYSDEPRVFVRKNLFPYTPEEHMQNEILYFCPIFFAGRELGYFILQYEKPDVYDSVFKDWLKIAANALEGLRMKNDIHELLQCQNLSEYHDTVTGLYNRNGFLNEINIALKQALPEENFMLFLIRTGLFGEHGSLDTKNLSVRIEIENAECLKKIISGKKQFCGKLAEGLYALAAVGNYTETYPSMIQDKINVLLQHSPLYSEHCSMDMLLTVSDLFPITEHNAESYLTILQKLLHEKSNQLAEKKNSINYQEYLTMRNAMYRNPSHEWNAQKTCMEFHLSYGYFRAAYKELFSVSFHQDLIQSRISYAKYLLLTTSENLTEIAWQSGYEDEKYFMRQFRQITGMTPSAYRNYH